MRITSTIAQFLADHLPAAVQLPPQDQVKVVEYVARAVCAHYEIDAQAGTITYEYPASGIYTFVLSEHDRASLQIIAAALGYDLAKRGVPARIIREALHFFAAKLATPACPDCGTDLVPIMDEDGEPSGRWYCPGCAD